jgi:hypothetical protein
VVFRGYTVPLVAYLKPVHGAALEWPELVTAAAIAPRLPRELALARSQLLGWSVPALVS